MKTPKIYASAAALLKLCRNKEQQATVCELFKLKAFKEKKFEAGAILREMETTYLDDPQNHLNETTHLNTSGMGGWPEGVPALSKVSKVESEQAVGAILSPSESQDSGKRPVPPILEIRVVLGVSHNLSRDAKDEDWGVECDKGSSVLRVGTNVTERAKAIEVIGSGFRSLNSGITLVPEGFSRLEIRLVKILGELIDGAFISSMSVANGTAIPITKALTQTASAILSGEKYTAFGSLEGRIQTLHGREGYPVACFIGEVQYKRTVVCHFVNKELEQLAVNAFRKRALVGGLIHYSKEGLPTSIDANILQMFPDEDSLPTLEQVQAIYK